MHWLIRHSKWFRLWAAAWFCGVVLVGWAGHTLLGMPNPPLVISLATMIPIMMLLALIQEAGAVVRGMRRFDGHDSTGCRVCTRCCFDLRASADQGVCPECGTQYTSESLAKFWTKRFPIG